MAALFISIYLGFLYLSFIKITIYLYKNYFIQIHKHCQVFYSKL
nr:MAG TPA: hypothetical protein [Caudoviricetes sp.]